MSAHLIPIRLYQILEKHSDQEHPLSMGELRRLLRVEYGVSCDRRTIYGALDSLRRTGCDIPDFQDSRNGYVLLSRKLEPAEVRLLLDCAAAFSGIGERQYRDLERKLLQGLSLHQRKLCRPLSLPTGYRGLNREVLLAVEVLEEAIATRCQVTFQYMEYGMDKKLHPRRERLYQVHPYGLCFANGNYYLICRNPNYETLGHYRVDRIQNPAVLPGEPAEPLPSGIDLPRYVRERVYQISGQSIQAVLLCENSLLSDVLDRFGMETGIHPNNDGNFTATVTAEPEGLKLWAMQYMERCEIREPGWLRQQMERFFFDGWSLYRDSDGPEPIELIKQRKDEDDMNEDGKLIRIFPALNGHGLTVEDMDLEVAVRNALKRSGIHTVDQLLQLSHPELLRIFPNRKLRSYEDVIHCLVCLSDETDDRSIGGEQKHV